MGKWNAGDIVRVNTEYGLSEVVSQHNEFDDCVWITRDDCNSEGICMKKDLILVCKFEDRKDKEDD